jgi:hypothetical protein
MYGGWRFCKVISIGLVIGLAFTGLMTIPFGSSVWTEPGVKGTVTDATGAPLEGVEIRVVKLDMSWGNGTYTNSTGEYMVNVTSPGLYLVAFVMDSYFENVHVVDITGTHTVDATLNAMPAESERVEGILEFSNGIPAEGYRVTLLYENQGDRHEYEDTTDESGQFGWDVFPGDFNLEVVVDGLAVISEEIEVNLGDGTLIFELVLPDLPPKDAIIKGYISDGTDPIQEVMVGVMDPRTEIANVTFSNETGYFEIGFWAGFHYLISMASGYEGYFRGIDVSGGQTVWVNVTLAMEEYTIKGVVNGPDGQPMEDVAVQYLQKYVFPESNSDKTDADGEFSIDVAGGDGFLMVVDNNPFETGRFDAYFQEFKDLSSNQDLIIDLTDDDVMIGEAEIIIDSWTHLSADTKMKLPINNSRAGRAMVDLMMGDGNLNISQAEFDLWEEAMMGDDSDISEGPFGNSTDENLTLNGQSFQLNEGTLNVQFVNFTGPVSSTAQLELQNSAEYTLQGDEPAGISRELSFNGSYSVENEEMKMHLLIPEGWRTTSVTETLHEVVFDGRDVWMTVAEDPDPDDEIESDWATLTFHDDAFNMFIDPVEDVKEGEEVNLTLNITDHLPDNGYDITWSMDGEEIENETMTYLYIVFPDNGSFEIEARIIDSYERGILSSITLEVGNVPPTVELEVIGGLNRTFYEGDVIQLFANASDVPSDSLMIEWGISGEYGSLMNYTDENSTMEYTIPDDGPISIQARVTDDDNGTAIEEIFLNATNKAPTFEYNILENELPGNTDVIQGENVTVTLSDIMDPSSEDTVTVEWIIPEIGLSHYTFNNDMSVAIIFIEAGAYEIVINVSDEDGGITVEEITFMVEENISFDQDGDGLPKWWEDKHGFLDDKANDAEYDIDSDNLTNLQEFEMGTDPRNDDTDEDGIPDDWDGFPLDDSKYDKDTDGDGHFDWDELKEGTDHLDADDYPGKKEDKDNSWVIWLALLLIGIILFIGIIVIWISRSREKGLEYEE